MSRESEPIWRSARLNLIGLPPCPKEISEPIYAALLFSKICTLCGRRALQRMDPTLLERLCGQCKKTRLVDVAHHKVDISLVLTSTTILPGYSVGWSRRGPWCFYDDAQVAKTKLDELEIAGDEVAKQFWIKRRREVVKTREQNSEPLKEWLQHLEMEREAELVRRRTARETEIKTRLQQLGHDERDMDFQNFSGWFSLVHNASPLTDKAWKQLLPRLLKIIKVNRRERIELEREDRSTQISEWAWDVCGSKVFYLCRGNYSKRQNLNATEILLNGLEDLQEVKPLLNEDWSDDEFENNFESQKPKLTDVLINWVDQQEARLISMMPHDVCIPDFNFQGSKSSTTYLTGDDYYTRIPIAALPTSTQKLLRADTIFMRASTESGQKTENNDARTQVCYFYPHFDGHPDAFIFSDLASEIAKNLLACLGRPNASHLEMESVGYALDCGMCPEICSVGWRDIIEHCLKEHWTDGVREENCGT
ncbi:hypothetical protein B0J17DRAFT_663398 [Rhizoctonia solani]|nr:hypothetical protein B0J17DRAFT_663398 [Rhizoctonia solani]